MRDLPSVNAQQKVLVSWFIKFAGWRPSEAAFGISGWSGDKRRRFFRRLKRLGCIAPGVNGWEAVKDIPAAEKSATA